MSGAAAVKVAVAGAEQHDHGVIEEVGHRDVGLAVVVEVGNRNAAGRIPHHGIARRVEVAVAVTEQDAHRVADGVADDDVAVLVAVDVGHLHGARRHADVQRPDEGESTRCLGEPHPRAVGIGMHGDQIGAAVAIDIAGGERGGIGRHGYVLRRRKGQRVAGADAGRRQERAAEEPREDAGPHESSFELRGSDELTQAASPPRRHSTMIENASWNAAAPRVRPGAWRNG